MKENIKKISHSTFVYIALFMTTLVIILGGRTELIREVQAAEKTIKKLFVRIVPAII